LYGWRVTFMCVDAPGLLLAAVALLTLKEPRLSASTDMTAPEPQPSLKDVCVTLWVNATVRRLVFCFALLFFFGYGISTWMPTFYIRSYELTTASLGRWLTLVYGLGGLIATYVGGELVSRHAANNERLQLVAIAISVVCSGVAQIF